MSPPKKRPDGDAVGFEDDAEVTLYAHYTTPSHPCPKCKGESKDSGLRGWRVCCGERIYVGLTEREHLELLDELAGFKARVQQFEVLYKAADKELTEALRMLRERGIL